MFTNLKQKLFDEVLVSVDFDDLYKKKKEIKRDIQIIPLKRFAIVFILNPKNHLKKDDTPYKSIYSFLQIPRKNLAKIDKIEEYETSKKS